EGQLQKKGTPTMGGFIIIAAILIPTFLFAKIDNVYIVLLVITTVWLGMIGFLDDYIKVFKKDKKGLAGKFKVVGQVGLGLIVGLTLYFSQEVVVRIPDTEAQVDAIRAEEITDDGAEYRKYKDVKSMLTTVPFMKNNELDYNNIIPGLPNDYTWIVYTLVVILVITAVSNGANITD